MDNKRIIKIQLLLFIIIFVVLIGFYLYRENNDVFSILAAQSKNAIYTNIPTGFYEKDLKIKLSKDSILPIKAQIFYTTNGENPDKYSKEYDGEISIKCEEKDRIIPLKVVAYYKGKYSDIQEFTYVVCDNIKERYDMPIISITTDRENLYDFEKGIFVPGQAYEDYIKEHDDDDYMFQTVLNGNYRERDDWWIKDAEIAMFSKDGQILNENKIGIAVSGGRSSAEYPKSLKLVSNFYDDLSQFQIEFLDNHESANHSIIDYYKTVRLRAGSQTKIGGNIRSTLVSQLANQAEFDGCFTSKIVLVYLNGEFYGIMDMEQNYSDSFIKNKYNLEDVNKVYRVKGKEIDCFKEAGLDKFFDIDLTQEENQKELEEKIDIKNYLEYYSINICTNNTDWPQNNYELWYYTGDEDENNPYTDGRARFLMYDFDMAYRHSVDGEWSEDEFKRIMNIDPKTGETLFQRIMQVKKYRDLFVTILLNNQKKSFNQENVCSKIDSIKENMQKETDIQFYSTGWLEDLESESETIKEVCSTVLDRINDDLDKFYGMKNKYEFRLTTSKGVTAQIVNQIIYEDQTYRNRYYDEMSFEISIISNPGYEINNIIINGIAIDKEQFKKNGQEYIIKISPDLIQENKIRIIVDASKNSEQNLVISEISAKDYYDWIRVSNYAENSINLGEYYLSNNEMNLTMYNLPNIILEPGKSIIVDGKHNRYSVGDYICNFSISKYQTIYLTKYGEKKGTRDIIDKIYVPKMQLNESYGRVNNSNIWNFYENTDSKRRK